MNQGLLGYPVGDDRALRVLRRQHIMVRDERAGTASAGDPPTGAFFTMTLNTLVHDETGVVRLASNQILVPPGSYRGQIKAWNMNAGQSTCRLRDVTSGVTLIVAQGVYGQAGGDGSYVTIPTIGRGLFTLTRDTLLEVQGWYGGSTGSGWSLGIGVLGNGMNERYTTCELWRTAT